MVASPILVLELEVLSESGRIRSNAEAVLDNLARNFGVRQAEHRLGTVVDEARLLTWTRDPFDRMIVAHSLAAKAPLLTADQVIRANVPSAVW